MQRTTWLAFTLESNDFLSLQPLATSMANLKLADWNLHFDMGSLRWTMKNV